MMGAKTSSHRFLADGHSIPVISWYLLEDAGSYRNLGGDYFELQDQQPPSIAWSAASRSAATKSS